MFALNVFGPGYRHRLDVLKDACPRVKNLIYVLTDKISYNNFYSDLTEDFNFVFIEDIREKYPLSLQHELIPNDYKNEEDHFTNLESFYVSHNNNYSYDLHRFIFPYFIDKGIKKFFIIDSDCIPTNNLEDINEFFSNIPDKSLFGPFMGYLPVDNSQSNGEPSAKQLFWKNLSFNKLTDEYTISKDIPYLDGWVRGFNFETTEDTQEFFDLWNSAYLKLLDNRFNDIPIYKNGEGPIIWSTEWLFSQIFDIFVKLKGYKYVGNYTIQPGVISIDNKLIAIHAPRPEDNLFYNFSGIRGAWHGSVFNYDGKRTISNFIKNNRAELKKYYENRFTNVEITDTHVYTRINN
jgi:hypothetical protein